MESEWMGRYRSLVAALVQHANIVHKSSTDSHGPYDGVSINNQEWQVLESIIENNGSTFHMNAISQKLGIPQSSFSRIVKHLCGSGLVEKYQAVNNKKNIILKPTEQGMSIYKTGAKYIYAAIFKPFFDALESISDEDLETVAEAVRIFNSKLKADAESSDVELVKLEQ